MKNAHERIAIAMQENERELLARVRATAPGVYRPAGVASHVWNNTIRRLIAAGKLRYSQKRYGYYIPRRGA